MADTTVGAELRAAREERGLGVPEIAQRTRIPIRHIAAIEDGDHAGLPAATYSAGFVKTYARLLGLDGHDLSQRFRAELADSVAPAPRREIYEPADPARTPSRALAWTALIAGIAILLGYLYWRGTRLSDDPAKLAAAGPVVSATRMPAPSLSSASPSAVTEPAAMAIGSAGQPAVLTATSAVWLKVYEKGGATLFMGVLDPGKSYTVPATAVDPRLQTGRPTALTVMVGNSAIPPLGAPERLVKDVSLKPEALLARRAPADRPPVPAASAPMAAAPAASTPIAGDAAAR